MCINKEYFDAVFTIDNRYNETKEYNEMYKIVEELIKKNEGHGEIRYVDNIYFDQGKKYFDVEIGTGYNKDKQIYDNCFSIKYTIDDIVSLYNKTYQKDLTY